ncbi:MAG: type II toxin-antitoxin system Phd/YefM family antitoxin [Longimicrobiales bacterium]|nr:type II toxin-antitoxin system Phd/YefM family antitoxin [Longimicrobiales bacterium]
MRIRTTVTEVLRNFSDYLNRVAYRGERFVLTRGGKEVAELAPTIPAGSRLADLPETLRSLPRLGPDDADLFADDLDRIRAEMNQDPPGDAWES